MERNAGFTPGQVTPEFWRGRRVFLTGHTGFKGSWMLWWLHRLGAEVTGFALPPERDYDLFHAARLEEFCAHRIGDIRDPGAVAAALAAARPEVVFHLAAQPLVRRSYAEPVETFATNVMGTAHVLEACREQEDLRAAVIITTDKVYENADDTSDTNPDRNPGGTPAFREADPLGGAEPYGYSKAGAEMAVSAWRRAFLAGEGVAVAAARSGNVIGGGDWSKDRLVPDAIRAFTGGTELIVRAPDAVRPWQHVVEPLAGYLMLAEALCTDAGQFARGWNFGPAADQCQPVKELVAELSAAWGDGARWRADPPADAPHEAARLLLDSSDAGRHLGWRSKLSMGDAIGHTAGWYREWHAGAEAGRLRETMSAQIDAIAPPATPADSR